MKNILTTAQASAYLSVTPARVRKLIRDRRLPAEKHGRDYFIDSASGNQALRETFLDVVQNTRR